MLSLVELENSTKPYSFRDIAPDAGSIFLPFKLAAIKVTKNIARKSTSSKLLAGAISDC